MKLNDELTKALVEASKNVLQGIKETEVQKVDQDFVDLHTIDDEEDPEQEKQVESTQLDEKLKPSDDIKTWIDDFIKSDDPQFDGKSKEERIKMAIGAYYGSQKNEGNEFTKAAAKAALAGEEEFEFDGETYPTEIDIEVAKKILGEKKTESVEIHESQINELLGDLIKGTAALAGAGAFGLAKGAAAIAKRLSTQGRADAAEKKTTNKARLKKAELKGKINKFVDRLAKAQDDLRNANTDLQKDDANKRIANAKDSIESLKDQLSNIEEAVIVPSYILSTLKTLGLKPVEPGPKTYRILAGKSKIEALYGIPMRAGYWADVFFAILSDERAPYCVIDSDGRECYFDSDDAIKALQKRMRTIK